VLLHGFCSKLYTIEAIADDAHMVLFCVKWLIPFIVFTLSFLPLIPEGHILNCPDVTLRCMKSHLCHVFISTCNVFCPFYIHFYCCTAYTCGSVADWLACWTHAQKGLGSNRSRDAVGNSLRQTAHIICASVHQAAKLVAALLRVVWVTAGLLQSNSSLPLGL